MAARSAIGLDIGTSGVRAAEVSFGRGQATLARFGQVALPEGAVVDGVVADRPTVVEALKSLWRATHFSSRQVVLGVGNQRVIVRQADLPWLPANEIRASLPYQVQELVPMPVDQALLDFLPIEEFTGGTGGRMVRGLLVAAAREMVTTNVATVEQAGLRPSMVDLTAFAVVRAMGSHDNLGLDAATEVLVDVGARITNVVIHTGGVPQFVRLLLLGGQDVTDALATRLGCSPTEAEALKQELSARVADEQHQSAARIVAASTSSFVDEIRGSVDYFLATSPTTSPARLVLTGGGARLAGLADELAAATRLPVTVGTPLASMKVGKTGLSEEQLRYVEPLVTVPVGLALGAAA
mgnify:CR=1 FL=1